MKIHIGTDNLPNFENSVITIGSYDGLHYGHKNILKRVVAESKRINGTSIIITFKPHPRHFLNPDSDFKLLSDDEEKSKIASGCGVDHLVLVDFNKEFASQSPHEYIQDFIVKFFNPKIIIIGYDHRFGRKRAGDINFLKEYQDIFDYSVEEITEQTISNVAVSSTKIRNALNDGNITLANEYLGYDYSLAGTVERGDAIGRKLDFPTANIKVTSRYKLIPSDGVYAVIVLVDNMPRKGMMHIGRRPSLENDELRLEVNIFDFDKDIYDQNIRVVFIEKIRDNKKFDSLELLKQQLKEDKRKVLNVLQ